MLHDGEANLGCFPNMGGNRGSTANVVGLFLETCHLNIEATKPALPTTLHIDCETKSHTF